MKTILAASYSHWNTDKIGEQKLVELMSDNNIHEKINPKTVLGASVGVGGNVYRLAILAQILVFPFFVYHFYYRSFNIFASGWTFTDFVFAVFGPPGFAIAFNWQSGLSGHPTNIKWYNPIVSILFLPELMRVYEHFKGELHIPLRQLSEFVFTKSFFSQYLHLIAWWCFFVSPFWILYWVGERTARSTYKDIVTPENKAELSTIISKNS